MFGGRSSEHDVSIITGLQACENLDKSKYNVIPVYLCRTGEWVTGDILLDTSIYQNFSLYHKKLTRVCLNSDGNDKQLYENERKMKPFANVDCCLLAMHGLHGEDGTLQGLLELKDIPYTSCGVTGSSVCMDKIVMKAYLKGLGLPILPWVAFDRYQYENEAVIGYAETLNYPLFVKPANSGSSIGVSKASNREELNESIALAFSFDNRVLVESAVEQIMEVNCAVVGDAHACTTSLIEQPITAKEFLTFEEKYLRGGKSEGMKSLARKIPADIPEEMTQRIYAISKKIFGELNLSGVVRLDFIIDQSTDTLYVNELNTIPGSFAFYLFEPMGINFTSLLDQLIDSAYSKFEKKKASKLNYDSELLQRVGKGTKGK